MARKKKVLKPKMHVHIRCKALANGNQSIYLDIYKDGRRRYEFLKKYLVPEIDVKAKELNKATIEAAERIRADRERELNNGDAGIWENSSRNKLLLMDWMEHFKERKEMTTRGGGYVSNIKKVMEHLKEYKGEKITIADVDKGYCEGFLVYLSTAKSRKAKSEKDKAPVLSKFTQGLYLTIFNMALKMAVKDGVLPYNPMDKTDKGMAIKAGESNRVYLDIDEVKALVVTECNDETTKMAFMFSCYTGLRISDIRGLRWSDLKEVELEDGKVTYKLSIIMQKTQRRLDCTLPVDALKWLPRHDGKDGDGLVFSSLPIYQYTVNVQLKKWAERAGIKKNVSFHTARHTFATLLLTRDADIYTTSKLLGHTRIATTEIYAKIVDKKKDAAMSLLDGVL